MTGPDGDLLTGRLAGFKLAGAGRRRSPSGSIAVEPRLPGRLGIGTHREPSDLAARRVLPAATRAAPAASPAGLGASRARPPARRAGSGARRVVPAAVRAVPGAVRAMPAARAATRGRAPPGTGTAPRAASGRTGRTGPQGPLRLPRVGRRRRGGAVSPATVWGSWITKNRPRLRSGQECGRALNPQAVVRRAVPDRSGRQGGRLVVEMLTVRRLAAHGVAPRRRAKCLLAARLLPVPARRSHRLPGRFHQNKNWKGKRATRTVAARTGL